MKIGIARRSANAAELCGDMAGSWCIAGLDVAAIADGLGHGRDAAAASQLAIGLVASWSGRDLLGRFKQMNAALRTTRGTALGVAAVDWSAGEITYAAVGNTRAALFGATTARLSGHAGIVGVSYRRLATAVIPFRTGDVLALWTDGLDERLELTAADRASVDLDDMATRLLERFARGNDDCCVAIAMLVPA